MSIFSDPVLTGVSKASASGPIASFSDGAKGLPLRSLLVNIDPVQAGTGDPSPDNVRPISGWSAVNVWRTGKNLLPMQTITKKGNTYYIGGVPPHDYLFFKAGTYTASNKGTSAYMYWQKKGTSDNNIIHAGSTTSGSFILTEDCEIRLWFYTVTADPSFTDIMLEVGSVAHDYTPYSGNQYTIQLGQTVYGGTLDVTNGVLTVDRAMVDLGTLRWTYNTTYAFFSSSSLTGRKVGVMNMVSDLFKTEAGSWSGIPKTNALWGNGSNATIYVQYPITEVSEFLSLISGHQLVYELDTPITIPLTPQEISTLQGPNNLWADSGDVDVEYLKQSLKYVGSHVH